MNEILNMYLLARGKFKPEMHLRQPGFIYSALLVDHLWKTKKE